MAERIWPYFGRATIAGISRPTGVPAQNFDSFEFGFASDLRVQADYDGDNIDDIAVFRPSTGVWYIWRSSDAQFEALSWGQNGDVPVPGRLRR